MLFLRKMTRCLAVSFLILSLWSSTYGSAIELRGIIKLVFSSNSYVIFRQVIQTFCLECGGSVHVGDEVVIDAPFRENCKWQIKTDEKHVLAFSLVHGGNFEAAQEFFSVSLSIRKSYFFYYILIPSYSSYAQIHDGLDVIQSENQIHHKVGLTSGELINTVYTTSSEAEVRFKKTPASTLKLKIQKV